MVPGVCLLLLQPCFVMRYRIILSVSIVIAGLAGCRPGYDTPPPSQVEGYKPVYAARVTNSEITFLPAQLPAQEGKRLLSGGFLYQLDPGKGIHIADISDPARMKRVGFVNVPGAQDLQIKDNLVLTNTYNDLLVLEVSGRQVNVLERIENAFSVLSLDVPPAQGYFECPDPAKGIVIGWEKAVIYSPKCR